MKQKPISRIMSLPNESITRREAFKRAGAFSAAVAAYNVARADSNALTDLERLEENSPMAHALGYKHDASDVDNIKFPQRNSASKICESCHLYQAVPDTEWGVCGLFARKVVSASGWCTAWVERVS